VSTTAAFHSQHHINAYQEEEERGGTRIVVDTAAYASPTFWTSKYPFGSLEVMRDREQRNHIAGMATVRRLSIDLPPPPRASSSAAREPRDSGGMSVSFVDVPVVDQAGSVYTLDFPFINRGDGGPSPSGVDGKPYCVFYAFACNAHNSTELAAWATLRIDMCAKAGQPNAKVWYKPQHYPQEPIFVPRPGATGDDDGVLLNNVLDGANRTTYLSILDGKTLTELARLDFYDPEVLPYMQHAAFFKHA
jgi:beta-carotene 15,15'-monooxygenase/beta,beta-carotene 9',10'-dioxygenase